MQSKIHLSSVDIVSRQFVRRLGIFDAERLRARGWTHTRTHPYPNPRGLSSSAVDSDAGSVARLLTIAWRVQLSYCRMPCACLQRGANSWRLSTRSAGTCQAPGFFWLERTAIPGLDVYRWPRLVAPRCADRSTVDVHQRNDCNPGGYQDVPGRCSVCSAGPSATSERRPSEGGRRDSSVFTHVTAAAECAECKSTWSRLRDDECFRTICRQECQQERESVTKPVLEVTTPQQRIFNDFVVSWLTWRSNSCTDKIFF